MSELWLRQIRLHIFLDLALNQGRKIAKLGKTDENNAYTGAKLRLNPVNHCLNVPDVSCGRKLVASTGE